MQLFHQKPALFSLSIHLMRAIVRLMSTYSTGRDIIIRDTCVWWAHPS